MVQQLFSTTLLLLTVATSCGSIDAQNKINIPKEPQISMDIEKKALNQKKGDAISCIKYFDDYYRANSQDGKISDIYYRYRFIVPVDTTEEELLMFSDQYLDKLKKENVSASIIHLLFYDDELFINDHPVAAISWFVKNGVFKTGDDFSKFTLHLVEFNPLKYEYELDEDERKIYKSASSELAGYKLQILSYDESQEDIIFNKIFLDYCRRMNISSEDLRKIYFKADMRRNHENEGAHTE